MKRIAFINFVVVTLFSSVALQAQQTTYAELSKKINGYWEGKLYKDGTEFVNINSIKVPKQLTDHSYYLRYEGPGWENQQVAYRIYLDWRNAIDIFGKKTDAMVLPGVGQDNYDSYHEASDWGQDIFKVGNALGIGSYGRHTESMTHHFQNVKQTKAKVGNAADESTVEINYKGWETEGFKTNLKSTISIDNKDITFKVNLASSNAIDGLCTGIKVFEQAPMIQKEGTSWGYIATYGTQTLVNDTDQLGLVVFYRLDQVKEIRDTVDDHLVIFNDGSKEVTYYAGAAWDQAFKGIKSKEAFEEFINRKLNQLDNEIYNQWSVRFMEDEMLRFPDPTKLDFAKQSNWSYTQGLVLKAALGVYDYTKDEKFFDYAYQYVDQMVNEDGSIKTYDINKYNIDMINSGKLLFYFYEKKKEERFLKALKLLRSQLEDHPRTSDGGFWHKKRYPYQMWLDGLYMGQPFYAQYAVDIEDGEQSKQSLDEVVRQFDLIQEHSYDSNTGLLYHGWDESKEQQWANKQTGTSSEFWSRALGWYAMALVDVLDYIPADYQGRERLITYLNSLVNALEKYQDPTGLWYQVVDKGNLEGNYLEASGTSMFTYAIAKGVRMGYLPKEKRKIAEKAYDGILTQLIKKADNELYDLTQNCAVAGLGGNPYRSGTFEYYIHEKIRSNDPKGTGPFILASLELNR